MKYLVWFLYFVFVAEAVFEIREMKRKDAAVVPASRKNYKTIGAIDFVCGMIGLILVNCFLRGKGIIPEMYVILAFIAFILIMLAGFFCLVEYMITLE